MPRTITERARDAHEDGSEAPSEARAASRWPRANAHLERRRGRAQVNAVLLMWGIAALAAGVLEAWFRGGDRAGAAGTPARPRPFWVFGAREPRRGSTDGPWDRARFDFLAGF